MFVSLRTKLLIGPVLIVAALMAAVTAVVEYRQRTTILDEVHRRGTALAEGLAGVSAGALLLYNFTAPSRTWSRSRDRRGIRVISTLPGVVAHSRDAGGGVDAVDAVSSALAAAPAPGNRRPRGGRSRLAVPILVEGDRWGTVRIALSRRRVDARFPHPAGAGHAGRGRWC
jgi:hypothetical protein